MERFSYKPKGLPAKDKTNRIPDGRKEPDKLRRASAQTLIGVPGQLRRSRACLMRSRAQGEQSSPEWAAHNAHLPDIVEQQTAQELHDSFAECAGSSARSMNKPNSRASRIGFPFEQSKPDEVPCCGTLFLSPAI